jgi:hypothetical protein
MAQVRRSIDQQRGRVVFVVAVLIPYFSGPRIHFWLRFLQTFDPFRSFRFVRPVLGQPSTVHSTTPPEANRLAAVARTNR